MKYRYFFVLLLLLFSLFISCEDVADNSCSGVVCDAPMYAIGLDYMDAESGESLIFGEDPPYSIDDLSAVSLETDREYFVTADSSFTDKKIALIYGSVSDVIKLTLGDLSTDTLHINTLFRDVGCCGEIVLTDVQFNDKTVCTDCEAIPVVEILK
ncbi:hypothetical protein [Rhodohalobacter sp.]|uniref:hypothetical protein n=1 Tax=Rhodohalobacter sp. TaxID=1974210 RepID=UPI002ACEA827|nr:hypothetical protein [Rhodohalobacter sp.]MDZ7754875.1 hypothetical protein [Rhodohalobacter sp.]